VAVLVSFCGRFSLWPFSFVAVLVEAVLVCGRFGCTPVLVMGLCVSVCPSVIQRYCVKTAEQFKLVFGILASFISLSSF